MDTRVRYVPLVLAVVALAACSSGPSPLQQWQARTGGQTAAAITAALHQITTDANTTGQIPTADITALGHAGTRGYDNCPPVDCAQWQQAMKDYLAASIAMTLANVTGKTGDYNTAATEISNATAVIRGLAAKWGVKLNT